MLTAVSYEDLTRATMAAVTLSAVAMPQAEDSLFGTLPLPASSLAMFPEPSGGQGDVDMSFQTKYSLYVVTSSNYEFLD